MGHTMFRPRRLREKSLLRTMVRETALAVDDLVYPLFAVHGRGVKDTVPDLLVVTDVCLCQYTSHGHCGVVEEGGVKNDPTLELLARVAVSHAEAGSDMVAPSDMMDGRVGAIREALDDASYQE